MKAPVSWHFVLSQSRDPRPRYRLPRRFDTMPSAPTRRSAGIIVIIAATCGIIAGTIIARPAWWLSARLHPINERTQPVAVTGLWPAPAAERAAAAAREDRGVVREWRGRVGSLRRGRDPA